MPGRGCSKTLMILLFKQPQSENKGAVQTFVFLDLSGLQDLTGLVPPKVLTAFGERFP